MFQADVYLNIAHSLSLFEFDSVHVIAKNALFWNNTHLAAMPHF